MVAANAACALCGLDIAGPPLGQTVGGEARYFCCQGCAGVWQLIQGEGLAGFLQHPGKNFSALDRFVVEFRDHISGF